MSPFRLNLLTQLSQSDYSGGDEGKAAEEVMGHVPEKLFISPGCFAIFPRTTTTRRRSRLSVIKSAFRNNLHTTLSSIHGYKALVTYHHHHHHPHITIVVEASADALAPSPRENQFHEEFQGYVQLFPLIVTRSTSFMGHSSDTKDDIRKAQ